jgi:O-antigen/teichoic acid export membrane protein
MNVAAQLIFDTDTVVVGVILGPLSVAAYQIALSPSAVLRQLADQFNVVALTTSSSLHAQGEESTVQRLLLESTRVTLVVMLPFVVVFSAWGTDFVRLWVGNGFRHSVPSLICLSTAMVLIAMQGTAAQVIMAHSRHRVIAIATSCEAIANLALSIVLGLHIGITGVALGTLIPTAFTALFVSMPYAARLAGVSMWRIFARLLPPIAGALALVWVCRQIDHAWHPFTTMVSLFATSAVLFGLFVAANLLGYRPERRTYLDLLSRPFRRA